MPNDEPIKYPIEDERVAYRRILEAAAQFTPVTAALAHMWGYSNPSAFEQEMEKFLRQIANTVNDHSQRFAELTSVFVTKANISPLAAEIALKILKMDRYGRCNALMSADLLVAMPGTAVETFEEAISELISYGYLQDTPILSGHNARVRPTTAMYLAFDTAATGHDPQGDAVELAKLLLANPAAGNFLQSAPALNWEPRRLNPALMALRQYLPGANWSNEIHHTYAETALFVTADERRLLKQLVETGRVD